jgi:hypothetical protein
MKKLGILALIAILGSMMATNLAATSLITNTVQAKPLGPKVAPEAADLNYDGNVTLLDLQGLMNIYSWDSSNPNWNSPIQPGWRNVSEADFNIDSRINLPDLVTMAYCFWYNRTS